MIDDEPEIKIGYLRKDGGTSKAYVDEQPDDEGFHYGIDKHTDEPLRVAWSEVLDRWEEV